MAESENQFRRKVNVKDKLTQENVTDESLPTLGDESDYKSSQTEEDHRECRRVIEIQNQILKDNKRKAEIEFQTFMDMHRITVGKLLDVTVKEYEKNKEIERLQKENRNLTKRLEKKEEQMNQALQAKEEAHRRILDGNEKELFSLNQENKELQALLKAVHGDLLEAKDKLNETATRMDGKLNQASKSTDLETSIRENDEIINYNQNNLTTVCPSTLYSESEDVSDS
ncbi:myocardial zonula adherens protein-like isoform X1 [Physella acuta]|uniref:myocardial zonula adherens protein-like isoform X1 n=1 Tax=Physella acuta TaxID=109671 RepID=UPI0027DD1D45|nr:myocardial zonula adherens protein-like isoform X1 [Physella acuta]